MTTQQIMELYNQPPQTQTQANPIATAIDTYKQNIEEFKGEALAWAKAALEADKRAAVPLLEIKEVKDLVSIVTQIEQTYSKKEDTSNTTINILNVIQRYDDDV